MLKPINVRIALLIIFVLCLPVSVMAEDIKLTQEEKDWLKQHPVIRVGIDAGYAPYSFTDKNNNFVGVAPDILSLIEQRLGIKFEYVPGLSWPQIVEGARHRSLDVIATAVITEERKKFLTFTQIYIPTPLVIMTRQEEDGIDSPTDLQNRTIALVKGYSSSQRIIQEQPEAKAYVVDTPIDGLRSVAVGDADAYVGVLGINVYLSSKHGITNLKIAGRYDVETNGQRLAIRNDWPELSSILDKALNAIPETQKLAILQRWVPTPTQTLLTKEQLIALGIAITFLVLILGVVWIWLLREQRNRLLREIDDQTRALHESERRLELALQGGGMAAWDMDFHTNKMIVSKGWWELMGLSETPSIEPRKEWLRHIHPDDCALVLEKEADYLNGELERYEIEYRIVTDEGEIRWQVIRGSSVKTNGDERSSHTFGLIQDITEYKELEQIKDEFVSSVSHELRTPLTSIKGSLGLIVGGAVGSHSEKAQEIFQIAYENSERLNLLINDLLDIQKLQSGKIKFKMEPLRINDLLSKAITTNKGYADRYHIQYIWSPTDKNNVIINGDEHRLLQVLANLLSNAIKFSPSGGKVKLSTSLANERVRVSVSDSGPGIPVDFQEKVFDRFSQADSSDSKEKDGTGLGLAIAKEIIERHKGGIGFDTKPKEGTTFYFVLPIVKKGS